MVEAKQMMWRIYIGLAIVVLLIVFRFMFPAIIAFGALCCILYVLGTIVEKIIKWWYKKK